MLRTYNSVAQYARSGESERLCYQQGPWVVDDHCLFNVLLD